MQAIPEIISGIVNALIENIPLIVQAGIDLLTSLIQNLPTIIVEIVKAIPQIITGIVNALMNGISSIVEVGANLVRGLWQGIQQLASWLWDKVSGWISSIWNGILDFFGHCLSVQGDGLGRQDDGQGSVRLHRGQRRRGCESREAMSEDIDGVMQNLAKDMSTALPTDFNVGGSIAASVSSAANGVLAGGMQLVLNITNFNNYSSEDIEQLTNEIMVTAGQFAKRKGVVFA